MRFYQSPRDRSPRKPRLILIMTAAKAPVIAFVIPCYNEQAGIQHTLTYLLADMAKLEKSKIISSKSYVVLVDDGSTDQTWRLVERITQARPKRVRALKLSRNVGHQNALLAGLLSQIGKADATISLDADLQDDMSVAAMMSDRALRALARYGETHVFLRGLAVQLGFKTASVAYDRLPRLHGETKYTLAKMVALAINGITSLSVRPIRMIALMGIMLFVVFTGMSVWVFANWLAGQTVQGWTSVMLLFLLIASFQTFAIAVIGEYVGKIYFETKGRPRYIIEQEIGTAPAKAEPGAVRNRSEPLELVEKAIRA